MRQDPPVERPGPMQARSRPRSAIRFAALALACEALVALSVPLAAWRAGIGRPPADDAANLALLTAVLLIGGVALAGGYGSAAFARRDRGMRALILGGVGAVAVVVMAIGILGRPPEFSAGWAVPAGALTGLALMAVRGAAGRLAAAAEKSCIAARTVLVGGTGRAARLAAELRRDSRGLHVIGFVAEPGTRQAIPGRWLGPIATVFDLIREGQVDEVIIALPWTEERGIHALIRLLSDCPVGVQLVTSCEDRPVLVRISEPPMAGWSSLLKRVEDLVLASAALLVCLLPMLLIALAIRLDSPGPVLFRQRRTGFNEQEFELLKFRSLHHEMRDSAAHRQARRGDPRVTRVGALLRRTSLDELPQLFNVLRGDMSMIGPRPHAPGTRAGGRLFPEVALRYAARHRIKPGLTGLAQVRGLRGPTENAEMLLARVESDLEYIEQWSLSLDAEILLRTTWAVLTMRNAC